MKPLVICATALVLQTVFMACGVQRGPQEPYQVAAKDITTLPVQTLDPNVVPLAFPNLQFKTNPADNDAKAIALTFDDGPDGSNGNTAYILDQLALLGVRAAFFVCGNVFTNVLQDPNGRKDIQRMIAEGHEIGNHTMNHYDLNTLNSAQIKQQFANLETLLKDPNVLGSAAPMPAIYRAPFGNPFLLNTAGVAIAAPASAAFGVHVGWGIDPRDWECAQQNLGANCVVSRVEALLDRGFSGPLLLHAVYKFTGDALPSLVSAIKNRGYHLVSVESMVQAKYGQDAASLRRDHAAANFSTQKIIATALAAGLKRGP